MCRAHRQLLIQGVLIEQRVRRCDEEEVEIEVLDETGDHADNIDTCADRLDVASFLEFRQSREAAAFIQFLETRHNAGFVQAMPGNRDRELPVHRPN